MKPLIEAGFPYQTVFGGILLVTMLPAPIKEYSLTVIPAIIVELAPIDAPSFTIVFLKKIGYCFERGTRSLVNVTLGPIKTFNQNSVP